MKRDWTSRGMWGFVPSSESATLKETRERLAVGRKGFTDREFERANGIQRAYEVAIRGGDKEGAEMCEWRMRQLQAETDRKKRKEPIRLPFGVSVYRWTDADGGRVIKIE